MSDFSPPGDAEFLTVGSPDPSSPKPSKKGRNVAIGIGAAVAVAAVGAGAWGFSKLSGGGPGAAQALPASALAYAAVDLDPSAGQKIEAIKTINKFPALKEELGLDAQDDLREELFKAISEDCDGLDYDDDVEPWLGDKAGVALILSNDEPQPLIALQSKDDDKAVAGIEKLFEMCDGDEEYGVATHEGYVLFAPTQEVVDEAVSAAAKAPLADDADFNAAFDKLDGLGIMSFYVAEDAPREITKLIEGQMVDDFATPSIDEGFEEGSTTSSFDEDFDSDFSDEFSDDFGDDFESDFDSGFGGPDFGMAGMDELLAQLDEFADDFGGAAGTIRFADGGVEFEGVATSDQLDDGNYYPLSIGNLPTDTVAALGVAIPDNYLELVEKSMGDNELYREAGEEFTRQTGLDLAETITTIFGKGLVFALDGTTDFESLDSGPDGLKAGLRIDGDPEEINRVIDTLKGIAGPEAADMIKVASNDDQVAIGFNDDYVTALLSGGDLGKGKGFSSAVPNAQDAVGAFFLDFDAADDWAYRLAGMDGDDEFADNVKPLNTAGLSAWVNGSDGHVLFKLTTD